MVKIPPRDATPTRIEPLSDVFRLKFGELRGSELSVREWHKIVKIYKVYVSVEAGGMIEVIPKSESRRKKIDRRNQRIREGRSDAPLIPLRTPQLVLIAALLSDELDAMGVPRTNRRHAATVGILDQARVEVLKVGKGRPVRAKEWTRPIFDLYREYKKLNAMITATADRYVRLCNERARLTQLRQPLPSDLFAEITDIEEQRDERAEALDKLGTEFRNMFRGRAFKPASKS